MSETHFEVTINGQRFSVARDRVATLAASLTAGPSGDLSETLSASIADNSLIGTGPTQTVVPDDMTPPADDGPSSADADSK